MPDDESTLVLIYNFTVVFRKLYEPGHEKTGLWGFRLGSTQFGQFGLEVTFVRRCSHDGLDTVIFVSSSFGL